MTPQDLIAAFETLAEAPNGVPRLRELVLQLAVRGQLVPKDPNDEPASVLLDRIAKEKSRLVKEGKIRKPKPLPPVTKNEVPFDVPDGWSSCRFQDVHRKLGAGSTPLGGRQVYVDDGFLFLRSQNVWNDGLRLKDAARISSAIHQKMEETIVRRDDVLLNITGASIARAAVVPADFDEANVSQHVAILRQVEPCMNRWVHLFLISPYGNSCIMNVQVGISRAGLSMNRLREFVLPVPPLAEQHRIVAKVDELMGLLDRLDAARTAREHARIALRDAALTALQEADTHDEVEVAWNRIAERMDDLFTDPADIDPLRQTVLQLAVRGRLVPQDPDDEPASVLLERIAKEKARLVKVGKIRKAKALAPVTKDEFPFAVPEGWAWSRFGTVTESRLGKMLDKAKNTGKQRRYLRNANVQWFEYVLDDVKQLRLEDHELAECSLAAGDLVICEGGEPGRTAVCDESVAGMVYQKALHRSRPFGGISPWYLAYLLRCDASSGRLAELFTGATIKHLTGRSLASYVVPLPPLSEQHRIVAKVDELMGLIDRLEERLSAKVIAHDAFAAAAVHLLDA